MNTVLKRMTAILAAVTLLLGCVGCGTRDTAESDQPIVPKTESATEEISESPDWEGILTEDPAEGIDLTGLALPESSGEFSVELARQVLALCTGHTAQRETELLECAGFTVAAQVNYDKGDAISHTCAYTVGLKQVSFGGEERTLVLIAVRGTEGGEWYSNFDFAPSRSDEGQFAENFLFAAEDAFVGVQSVLASVRAQSWRRLRKSSGDAPERGAWGRECAYIYVCLTRHVPGGGLRRGVQQYFQCDKFRRRGAEGAPRRLGLQAAWRGYPA